MFHTKNRALIGLCISLFILSILPFSQMQQLYQSYFWRTETNQELSAIQVTGDLDADPTDLSEVVVAGNKMIALLDGYSGTIYSNYTIQSPYSFSVLAVGNLDSDTKKEIVAGSTDGNLLVALKYNQTDGNLTKMWEDNFNVTQICVADILGNASNEVVVGDKSGILTILNNDGLFLWNQTLPEPIVKLRCLDFSQDNVTDQILVLTTNYVTLFNTTGDQEWQVSMTSPPLDGLVGDVQGDAALELIIKGQNMTFCLDQDGNILWNSTLYSSDTSDILLYQAPENQKSDILIAGINGSYLLYGTNGTLIRTYLTNSSITCLVVGTIFGGTFDYLVMGDQNKNVTIWTMNPIEGVIYFVMNITLSAAVLDLILLDMNNDGIPDMVTASLNGTVYIIGVPWLIDTNWVFIGIGIGAAVIIASIVIVMKLKGPSAPQKTPYHIK